MALLPAKKNVALGNQGFEDKKLVFKESGLILTALVTNYDTWTPDDIIDRQKQLATIAVQAWPLS